MTSSEFIGKIVTVEIDRPIKSRHSVYGFEYLLNYGFIHEVFSPDGEEIDAYVLGVTEPLASFNGRCIAVIHRLDDNEDKLVIAQDGKNYLIDQIREMTHFQEQFSTSVVLF
jgi:inorganic pyrophosphatase